MTRATNPPPAAPDDPAGPDGQPGEEKPVLDLSATKIAGGALAAVTTALAASFLGVNGTVSGAAFGSIISSIAAAIYAHSLSTARSKIKTTRTIALRPPRGRPEPVGPDDPTALPADLTGRSVRLPGERDVFPAGAPRPPSGGRPDRTAPDRATPDRATPDRTVPRWLPPWRPVALFAGFTFLIAMIAISVTELAIGHPVGNSSAKGTTVVSLLDGESRTKKSPTPSTSPDPSASTTTPSQSPSDSASTSTDVSPSSGASDSGLASATPSDAATTALTGPAAPQPTGVATTGAPAAASTG